MFRSVQRQSEEGASPVAVDVAPLVDVVFILLVFFLVTATFVRDTGIEVERPEAASGRAVTEAALRISIAPSGAAYLGGERVAPDALRSRVEQHLAEHGPVPVVIIPDRSTRTEHLVQVMDAARRAGAETLAVATERGGR